MAKRTAAQKALNIHDETIVAIRRIETLAALLSSQGNVPLDPEMCAETAEMICEQAAQIRDGLTAMRKLV